MDEEVFDILIIGGGINGVGIARDAAGRGLKVALCEKDDLASATSSASSKLIHGGLRYLEHYEFRLVSEALTEREILLNLAPHLVIPTTFVLPYVKQLRPAWMLRLGLLLYDTLGRRSTLHPSHSVKFAGSPYSSGLKPDIEKGFIYSDCAVDDARLVILNAFNAAQLGARIFTRTKCTAAKTVNEYWHVTIEQNRKQRVLCSRVLVNASGPWVSSVLSDVVNHNERYRVRLVKGSHIVVPRFYDGTHAYILQNEDGRVIFIIPYLDKFTLIGTTDIPFSGDPSEVEASKEEIEYLCNAANHYSSKPLSVADVVWTYAGLRPLFDDGTVNPSSVTRDYKLHSESEPGGPLLLSIFGGKITTYRKLAEAAMDAIGKRFPNMKPRWTAYAPLPGGDIPNNDFERFFSELSFEYAGIPEPVLFGIARRHGTLARKILDGAKSPKELGPIFGDRLCAREVDYLFKHEWAKTAEDILWRRTKAGLYLDPSETDHFASYFESIAGGYA